MGKAAMRRPFDNFRTAVTDPSYFFGRKELLTDIRGSPYLVRMIIGGRRFGKSSLLRAIEWTLLDEDGDAQRDAFPVLLNLERDQPNSLSNLRYILTLRLCRSLDRWRKVRWVGLRNTYRQFLRQVASAEATIGFLKLNVANPERERQLVDEDFRSSLASIIQDLQNYGFGGVCFLFDEAEFIVRRDWADDAWSYLRGLKHDESLGPTLGFVISGYRAVKEYSNRVGSPLANIADEVCLEVLNQKTTVELTSHRTQTEGVKVSDSLVAAMWEASGGHPYLAQQILSSVVDGNFLRRDTLPKAFVSQQLRRHNRNFGGWWNVDGRFEGCGENERLVYYRLCECEDSSIEGLAESSKLSPSRTADALEVLQATGVIRPTGFERYTVGSGLFREWVQKRFPCAPG